jgi:nucleoside phosphorylase
MSNITIDIRHYGPALNNNYVLILTSNSIEKEAVNHIIDKHCAATTGVPDRGCRIGFINDRLTLHISGESGGSRLFSIGRIATNVLKGATVPKPALIILSGFCWGNPQWVHVGDVIISTTIYSLNQQRISPETTSHLVLPYVSELSADDDVLSALRASPTLNHATLISGPVASLETYFGSNDARDRLLKSYPQLVGGEMEGYHFLPDCAGMPWIIVKAVSDAGGDLASREYQADAARHAAEVLPPLVTLLPKLGRLTEPLDTAAALLLADAILGNTVVVTASETNAHGLNDYLNDVIGPRIDLKLQRHSSDLELGERFPAIFCDLILEVTQNAFRHGNAQRVEISFTETKISIRDDGKFFDINMIEGSRGGARALKAAKEAFVDPGYVTLKLEKPAGRHHNKYVFDLRKVFYLLQEAKHKCWVTIVPNTVGAPMGPSDILQYDRACTAVYLSASGVRMTSRSLNITEAIRGLVAEGERRIFVGCRSQAQVIQFQELLSDLPSSQVSIFVE